MELLIKWLAKGLKWLVNMGINGILGACGKFCRFMVTECGNTFILFALIGAILYSCGCSKLGMKFIRVSLLFYLIMGFVGWCF